MNLVVSLEYRFHRTPDGKVWTETVFAYPFWQRYLAVFDHLQVIARVNDVETVPDHWQLTSGEDVSFTAIPYYIGPWKYLLRRRQVQRVIRTALRMQDAVILRVSSLLASSIEPLLRRTKHPYGVEVLGDPYDVFAPGSVQHPLRPFFRWWFFHQLRQQCAHACAAAYVTNATLQRRYPCSAYSVGVSDVELPPVALVSTPRSPDPEKRTFRLIMVGSLAQMYKAPDILIEAMAHTVQQGLDLTLTLVGDGKYRKALEQQVLLSGLQERVHFCGQLTGGAAVWNQLDQADLFVLPSRTEGLPRALIEAMARGLPCIGSTVGGIPELLPAEDMVPPNDILTLATRIREVVTDPARMARMSARNLEHARMYREDVLWKRRLAFYRYVRDQTMAWLEGQTKR